MNVQAVYLVHTKRSATCSPATDGSFQICKVSEIHDKTCYSMHNV